MKKYEIYKVYFEVFLILAKIMRYYQIKSSQIITFDSIEILAKLVIEEAPS